MPVSRQYLLVKRMSLHIAVSYTHLAEPAKRYISDGDPGTVVIPEELVNQVDRSRLGDKTLLPY